MKNLFELLDEVSHQLNSPLASAKSYVYLAQRAADKNDATELGKRLVELDKKLDVIAHRVDLVMTALRLQDTNVSLSYEFFPLSTLTGDQSHVIEVMADKALLTSAFIYAQELTGSHKWNVLSNKTSAIAALPILVKPSSVDKDMHTEFLEKAIILHATVKHHGGTVEQTEQELKIALPLKPKGKTL
jgi:signal transduction histidine kinase